MKKRSEWPRSKPSAPRARNSAPSRQQRLLLLWKPRLHPHQKRPAPKKFLTEEGIGKLWLTKLARQAHQVRPGPRALVLPVLADARPADVPAVLAAADESSFAARRSANSASKRSTPSTIATCVCCSNLSPSGARSCLAA